MTTGRKWSEKAKSGRVEQAEDDGYTRLSSG